VSDQRWDPSSTIGAVATPPGRGGIGVVRLSGTAALEAAAHLFRTGDGTASGRVPPAIMRRHRAMIHGHLVDPKDGAAVDDALLLVMPGPGSYTGEDVVEFHCHGSPTVLNAVLEACLALGVRLAEPGEFSLRAVRNGRFDLTQAEAVLHLVNAETTTAAKLAVAHLDGALGRELAAMSAKLLGIAAPLEAAIDFPDDEVAIPDRRAIAEQVSDALGEVSALADSGRIGRRKVEGAVVTIAGPVNAGKSTLFNALLGRERAIVTPEAGTTRDVIEARLEIQGLAVTLRDTAGLRTPSGLAEEIGVRLARVAMDEADLILLLADASQADRWGRNSGMLSGKLGTAAGDVAVINVLNKCDLVSAARLAEVLAEGAAEPSANPPIMVSAMTGTGLTMLREQIAEHLTGGDGHDSPARLLTTIRQERAVRSAAEHLAGALEAIRRAVPDDLLLVHIYSAMESLDEARGAWSPDLRLSVIEEVFARFCVGK